MAVGFLLNLQIENMNTALWIGIGAAALVVLAHVALFYIFMRVSKKKDGDE